ncbi:tyrosine protein phosphatase [Streptococcus suis]|uniref:capsular polysaccharide biosynthesis protein Cps4B n=2 Tax=Streptococcus suis TaxID=1307 RepID=UPI00129E8008|nr:capsular polysaccharide biosynthesis protein Cps4B [Streptococcus suis]MCK3951089.1 tyrosine protein phosphatase [Streptococcus suis]MCP8329845.1 tyrosine protein phosphatase [Streptococcus suis]MCP8649011.1 tyrosine protein phosphatase [Streptococcus suis]MDG3119423.1 tyrosine protein phosphatase [Streptococcus suis]MDW8736891.1 capsular polysaccharide biosynthesis protein Cps4B [Streptococcus suis]
MIDIHSHIIFGVDDGPKTIEESLSLISEAYRQGVRYIVATSHRRKGMFETPEKIIMINFLQLKEAVAEVYPEIRLCYGAELYYSKDILSKLEKKKVPTLNGSRYILLEFSTNTPWKEIQEAVNEMTLLGLTPVLAHIERYDALAFQSERVEELIDKGCYTQVNSNHVLKPALIGERAKEFKKRTRYFLEQDLVHCVASDMHNLYSRPPFMREAYQLVKKEYGEDRAKALFKKNPLLILKNQVQ